MVRTVTEEELPRTLSGDSPYFTWELLLSQGFPGWPPPLRCCCCVCTWSHTTLIPTLACRLDFLAWPCTCLVAVDVLGDHQAVADTGHYLWMGSHLHDLICHLFLLCPCCSMTQSREGIHTFRKEVLIYSIAATCQWRCFARLQVSAPATLSQKECLWSSVQCASSFNSC